MRYQVVVVDEDSGSIVATAGDQFEDSQDCLSFFNSHLQELIEEGWDVTYESFNRATVVAPLDNELPLEVTLLVRMMQDA